MAETENLKLALPGSNEYVDVEVLNDNFRKIDASILLALAAASPYSTSQTYAMGAYCTRGGKLYKANQAISAAEDWTAAHWTETTMGSELVAIYTTLANNDPRQWGLGGTSADFSDANDCVNNGFYRDNLGSALNTPFGFCHMIVTNFGEIYVRQDAYLTGGSGTVQDTRHAVRIKHPNLGGWGEWEWDAGMPMLLGVEYRTTERHLGKPMYTKLVDFGALPNASSKDVMAGDATCCPIRVSGYVYQTGENERFETIDGGILPTSSVQSDYNDVWINAYRQSYDSGAAQTNMCIHIVTRKDFSHKLARVQVWYTKTTD